MLPLRRQLRHLCECSGRYGSVSAAMFSVGQGVLIQLIRSARFDTVCIGAAYGNVSAWQIEFGMEQTQFSFPLHMRVYSA
jgi:hypothetical protein